MDGPIQNRGTYTHRDLFWQRAFGSKSGVERFLREGRVVEKTMRLSKLGYKSCDFALERAPSLTRSPTRR
jgi:hypothetical protein